MTYKRTTKTFSVDGTRTLLLPSGPMLVHAIVRERDFTHNRLAGFAHTMEDAHLWAASADLLEALELSLRNVESMINMLPFDADPVEEKSLETWRDKLRAAIAKAKP